MNTTTRTALAIDSAARTAGGDFYATVRALGRFCTEALVDAAEQCLESLTTAERAKFASTVSSAWGMRRDRDWAVEAICCYMHAIRIREWAEAFERSCVAARAEFPAAYEALGAVL